MILMRILIYGAGVIGSLYAALFAEAGYDTSIYARGKRFEALRNNGLLYKKNQEVIKAEIRILKSLFAEESFDSYSGEYELARLLNTSPHIVWWHRLHAHYGAFIYYNAKDRYFPDFVACDDSGVCWIIEGKDQRGRDDAKVQEKRKAAESLVRRLIAIEEYVDQKWGYLIAYEDDIAKSDSWDDLKTFAQPVCNDV